MVLSKDESKVSLDILLQAHFKLTGDFSTPLAVPISHREKVAVLQTAKVGHCYPSILIRLVRVTG